MSLATRCSSCQTAFRVVQDQLNVSEGWVRCGRCGNVFSAVEGLFDLESPEAVRRELPHPFDALIAPVAPGTHEPVAAPAPAPMSTDIDLDARRDDVDVDLGDAPAEAPPAAVPSGIEAASLEELLTDPTDARLFRKRRGEDTPAVQVDARDRLEFSDARFDSDLFEEEDAAGEPDLQATESAATGSGVLPLESSAAQPDFMRRAEHRARWRSRPVRALLLAIVAFGAVALVLQVGHHFRDTLAARKPALGPALAAWCGVAACAIEAPRSVDAWVVDSTALSRAIGIDAYALAVTLRNRAPHAVALPWIELTLTDANGRLVSRRTLSPTDFRVAKTSAAGAEVALQLSFDAGSTRVAGYTVEIFNP